jgi:trimeric autotransporter adhesin
MQRYSTLLVLFLLTVPVGLSIQGCANKNSSFCNGAGYSYTTSQPVSITLGPQITGLSVAYGQIVQLNSPTATTCTGASATIATYTYGTTNRTIADVSPTGSVCGGTWNLNTPGVANFTTCVPTSTPGVVYMTAQGAGFTSNQVAVYAHPPITTMSVTGPTVTEATTGQQIPACLSQNQTTQLDATAYTTNSAGKQVLLCSPSFTETPSGPVYGPTDCNNVIGHITYSTPTNNIVTINQTGVATAQAPGATLIFGSLSNTSSTSGYFYTCSPKSIALSLTNTGSTTGVLQPNNPQPLTATVTDTNNNVINGLALTYVSTNPASIAVSATGSVTSSFPSSSTITAVCDPSSCNQAPIAVMGTLGAGATVISNSVQVSSPGYNSTLVWSASPNSPYFVPIDLSTGTTGTQIKLPYTPNSMAMDQTGVNLYFGSYNELMIYTAATNALQSEVTAVPGVVLAVAPNNTGVIVNDQLRGVIYLYTPAVTTTTTSSGSSSGSSGTTTTGSGSSSPSGTTTTAATVSSIAGVGQRAAFTPDGQTAYVIGKNVLYVWNTYTGWTTETLPAGQGASSTGVCPANNSSSLPNNGSLYPPNTPSNPNNSYNAFCSPDLAVTVPNAGVFLTGSPTSAYGICPDTTVTPPVNYPEAATVAAASDHVAATTDGKHIIGAVANPPTLTDISITVPINSCPVVTTPSGVQQTTGFTFSPAPTFNQTSLAAYGITNINQVVASTNSSEAFVTYLSNATAPPAGGALLPVYEPSAQPGNPGTMTNVKLAGNAIDPIDGIFSPDNSLIILSTTGDDQLHLINTSTLTDTGQINPKLVDANGNPVAPQFLVVKPRPVTSTSTD